MAPTSVVVTGANRGIGLGILHVLLKDPSLFPSHLPLTIYACSRSGSSIPSATSTPSVTIIPIKLDISSPSSIQTFASQIASSEPSGLSILINNAAAYIGTNNAPFEEIKLVIDVNYTGTRDMCTSFLPLMSPNGRIVNVSSDASLLHPYSPRLANRFRDPEVTVHQLDDLAADFLKLRKTGTKDEDWGNANAYQVSKALLNGLTVAIAREGKEKGILVNACHPGWVQTDMGYATGSPPKSLEQGTLSTINLAFKDFGGTTGGFWSDVRGSAPGEGILQKW